MVREKSKDVKSNIRAELRPPFLPTHGPPWKVTSHGTRRPGNGFHVVLLAWGRIHAKHQRAGRKLPLMDSFLAATALHHQLTIVTRNTADFPDDVPVLNPWTG
jgi:hypothetical protein